MAKALIKAGLRLFCSQTSEDRLSRVEAQIEKPTLNRGKTVQLTKTTTESQRFK